MSQIINIFRKDARRHWVEIVLSLATLAAYTWNEGHTWSPNPTGTVPRSLWDVMAKYLSGLVAVLVPVSWWFLTFRVVQGESLVGDRQFWTTRPYEWKKLLAAKILFVLVFINAPLLLAGSFLLSKAGFSPAPYWLGLLWMQLLLIQIPLLPFMALAAVTRNIAQGLLVMPAIALYMGGLLLVSTVFDSGISSSDATDWLQAAVLTIVCGIVVGLQYAWRGTARSRLLLVAGAAVIFLILALTPLFVPGDREFQRPSPGETPPLRASLAWERPATPKKGLAEKGPVRVGFPILTAGLQDRSLAQLRAVMLTLETADGFRWSSGWQGVYELILPGENILRWNTEIDRKVFDRVKSVPVKARVALAATIFHDQDARQIAAGNGEFLIPDVGLCRIDAQYSYYLDCRSPLVKPARVLVRADSSTSTCPRSDQHATDEDEQPPAKNAAVYAWEWNGDPGPAEYGVSPVESFKLYFWNREPGKRASVRICAGTPLSVSFPTLVQRTRVEFEVNDFKVSDYRQEDFLWTGVGTSVIHK